MNYCGSPSHILGGLVPTGTHHRIHQRPASVSDITHRRGEHKINDRYEKYVSGLISLCVDLFVFICVYFVFV